MKMAIKLDIDSCSRSTELPAVRPDEAAHWAGAIAPVINGK